MQSGLTSFAEEIEAAIAPPNKAKVGDFTLPAFPFIKKVKYPGGPPAVAKLIAEKARSSHYPLLLHNQMSKSLQGVPVQAEGPYVNITLSPSFVAQTLMPVLKANPTKCARLILLF